MRSRRGGLFGLVLIPMLEGDLDRRVSNLRDLFLVFY